MNNSGVCIRFYVHEEYYRDGVPLSDWILQQAKALQIHGASVFKALKGFGRHGRTHEENFIGAPADFAPVVVEFLVTDAQATSLKTKVAETGINVFVAQWPAHSENLGEK